MTTEFVLAGGCFWCLDAAYRALDGIEDVVSGYTGGTVPNPSYELVCTGTTGHAEAVKVIFDEKVISGEVILDVFFTIHDPRQLNRQGNDIGTQYRSSMFYQGEEQRILFEKKMAEASQNWGGEITTLLEPLGEFYDAEDYHQDFFAKNPEQGYCLAVAVPKIMKVRQGFAKFLKVPA